MGFNVLIQCFDSMFHVIFYYTRRNKSATIIKPDQSQTGSNRIGTLKKAPSDMISIGKRLSCYNHFFFRKKIRLTMAMTRQITMTMG